MEIGPRLANCPREHSMKNKGKPAKANIRVYGMRKAPEGREGGKHKHTGKTMNFSVFTPVPPHFISHFAPASNISLWVLFCLQNGEDLSLTPFFYQIKQHLWWRDTDHQNQWFTWDGFSDRIKRISHQLSKSDCCHTSRNTAQLQTPPDPTVSSSFPFKKEQNHSFLGFTVICNCPARGATEYQSTKIIVYGWLTPVSNRIPAWLLFMSILKCTLTW